MLGTNASTANPTAWRTRAIVEARMGPSRSGSWPPPIRTASTRIEYTAKTVPDVVRPTWST